MKGKISHGYQLDLENKYGRTVILFPTLDLPSLSSPHRDLDISQQVIVLGSSEFGRLVEDPDQRHQQTLSYSD